MLTENLLKNFRNSNVFNVYLIDKDGKFILNPDNKYSWNKYTGVQRNLSEDFPLGASQILEGKSKGEEFFAFNINGAYTNFKCFNKYSACHVCIFYTL